MSSYAYRFVGDEGLPKSLTAFDLEQFFQLTGGDVNAVNNHFRSDYRLPAALMLLFMRAAGRPLDRLTVVPRNLLRYVAETFGRSAPTIASLRYQRSQTLYALQASGLGQSLPWAARYRC